MLSYPKITLASASPRRRDLLMEAGFDIEVIPAQGVCERLHDEDLSPCELVEYNAKLKAEAVHTFQEDQWVLGADTLVFLDGVPLSKPANKQVAQQTLMQLSGRTHEVYTGVCLIGPKRSKLSVFHDCTKVTFHPFGAHQASTYLKQVNVSDKAGAYAIQEHGELLVEEIAGSRANVIGFPVERFQQIVKEVFA